MNVLTYSDIKRIVREELNAYLKSIAEKVEIDMNARVDGEVTPVVTPELKVKHKKSGIRYTVDSVGDEDVILRTPEGDKFIVDAGELEDEYVLR